MGGTVWSEREDGTIQLATRIPQELHRRMKIEAFKSGATLSDWVSDALTRHLERCTRLGGAKHSDKATT